MELNPNVAWRNLTLFGKFYNIGGLSFNLNGKNPLKILQNLLTGTKGCASPKIRDCYLARLTLLKHENDGTHKPLWRVTSQKPQLLLLLLLLIIIIQFRITKATTIYANLLVAKFAFERFLLSTKRAFKAFSALFLRVASKSGRISGCPDLSFIQWFRSCSWGVLS